MFLSLTSSKRVFIIKIVHLGKMKMLQNILDFLIIRGDFRVRQGGDDLNLNGKAN